MTTNVIGLVTKFQPLLDELYVAGSLTARMDTPSKPVSFAGANVVKVYKTTLVGLGTYSRTAGYPVGDVVGAWETMTLATERGRELFIDREDDEETLGMAYGTLVGQYMNEQVTPELDAYRFSKYASWSGITQVGSPATLTAATVLAAIDAATASMNANSVPVPGRVLYVSDSVGGFINASVSRMYGNDSAINTAVSNYNGMPIIMVPQTRFYKGITLDAGSTTAAGGFAKTNSTGRDINFLMVAPSAILQVKKFDNLKIFDPDTNQDKDGWKIQIRLYHDAFVYDNKVTGVYSHIKAS
jgi:hypothetical protein